MIKLIMSNGVYGFNSYAEPLRMIILHRLQDGYIPAKDGTEIKEELTLHEFTRRLSMYSDKYRGTDIEKTINNLKALLQAPRIENKLVLSVLDAEYANIFRSGKCVLAEHTMSIDSFRNYTTGCDPYGSVLSQAYKPSKKEEKENEEIYYLLT